MTFSGQGAPRAGGRMARHVAVRVALLGALCAACGDRLAAQRDEQRWEWSGAVEAGRWVYVRNLNGPVRVEGTAGNTVEVVAYKRARRRGRPEDVRITVEQRSARGDVVICAIWHSNTRCDEDGYSTRSSRSWWDRDDDRGDVSVEFIVRLPHGVRVTATSVNGAIEINGAESEVVARTVNGDIRARTTGGPVSARTTNGSLDISAGTLGGGPLEYATTNGAIAVTVPPDLNADVELRTVNGGITTDFPLTIEGRFNNRRVRGTIGKGGPLLRLSTTNGSIRLRKA
jgi:hypothetical protein